jgi:Sulfotransferase domain
MSRWPDFLIIGAPRSGTTSLYKYLQAHPDIFMPKTKEPHYFGADLQRPGYVKSHEQYLDLFLSARPSQRTGEASAWYLYSQRAAGEIARAIPDCRIIVILRNPIDFMYSLHHHLIWEGSEDIRSFETALGVEAARRRGDCIPNGVSFPERLQYRKAAKFAEQLERYLHSFPEENVNGVLLEELASDPTNTYSGLLRFLDLDDSFRPEFAVHNIAHEPRSERAQRVLRQTPQGLRSVGRALVPRRLRRRLRLGMVYANLRYRPIAPLRSDLRRELEAEFEAEVSQIEAILGREVRSLWRWGTSEGQRAS